MLAIVIPYYKLTFFERTLASLAAQTNKKFSVYVGDDASPDDCANLIATFQNKFQLKYYRFKKNLGSISLTEQWHRCIDLIENEDWVMILGDDDVIQPNVVEYFWKNLSNVHEMHAKVIRFATTVIDENQNNISENYKNPQFEKASDSFFRKFKGQSRSSLSEYIFARNSFEKHHFKNYPIAWHSDDMAWLEFSEVNQILSINDATVFIRKTLSSISGNSSNSLLKKKAIQLFFTDILTEKLYLFTKNQKLELAYSWEQKIKWDRNLNRHEWFLLLKIFIQNFDFLVFIKFVRRMILGMLK